MSTKGFWIYKSKVVAIKKVLEAVDGVAMVEIRYIQRFGKQTDTIPVSQLSELTRWRAEDLLEKYNKRIAQSNVQIHAINECLRYM